MEEGQYYLLLQLEKIYEILHLQIASCLNINFIAKKKYGYVLEMIRKNNDNIVYMFLESLNKYFI